MTLLSHALIMSFFRYALLDTLRGRRTLSSILGVLLAVTFLSGTFIAIDSGARATLEGLLGGLSGDFSVRALKGDAADVRVALLLNPNVTEVEVYVDAYLGHVNGEGEEDVYGMRLGAVDPANLPGTLARAQVTGSRDFLRGTIALSQWQAAILNVQLDDFVTIREQIGWTLQGEPIDAWLNLTVAALVVVPDTPPYGPFYPGEPFGLIHIQDFDWIQEQLGIPWPKEAFGQIGQFGTIQAEVRVDRDRFINPYDLEGSKRNLARFQRDLQRELAPFSAAVTDNLSSVLNTYESQVSAQRVVYVIFSLPVLLLGLYLGAVGVDLGHAERRRELAVLRARGAGRGQVLGLLLLMAVLGGVVATLVGLLAGVALSRLLLVAIHPFALTVAPTFGDLVLSLDTVIIVAVFSVVFMLLVSYRSARRTAKLPVAETLRHYAPGETRIAYKPTVDLILVSLGVLSLVGLWYVRFSPGTLVTFLVGSLFIVLLPATPIFLIVGVTRLLTRSTGKVYEWVARIWKPVAGSLYHIISRNLRRNPRRSANVAIIIALGLAFGMLIFAFLGTTQGYQERIVRAQIGADVAIFLPPTGDATFAANVSQLDTVAGVTRVQQASASLFSRFVEVYAVEPETLFQVTQPEPWYFDGLSPTDAAAVLGQPGTVLASKRSTDSFFLEVGDQVTLTGNRFNESSGFDEPFQMAVTVGGSVRALPGTVRSTFDLPSALYANVDTFGPFFESAPTNPDPFESRGRVLVDLQPGADWRTAQEAILGLGGADVRVVDEQLIQQRSDPFFSSIQGFIGMEIAFMAVILTAGLALILFTATLERRIEFAAIRARGATGWQAAGLLTGEAFSIMLVGIAIGVGVGLLVAYFLIQLFVLAPPGVEALVPLLFQVPLEGFLLVALVPAAMLLTALLISARIARMNIAQVLKIRGG